MTYDKPDKFAIAQILRDIGALLKMKGENKFRAGAYDNAASALEGLSEDLSLVIKEARLTQVRNIGNSIAAVIGEIYETGTARMLDELRVQFPPGILELGAIPGLSVKKIETLHAALGIASLSDLKKACAVGVVRNVKGFSEKSEKALIDAIAIFETRSSKILLVDALEIAQALIEHMRQANGVSEAGLAGQVSRWEEAVDGIDLVVAGEHKAAVFAAFENSPHVADIEKMGEDRAQGSLAESRTTVRLFVCAPHEFIPCLHYWTCSIEYNEKLSEIASARGFDLTEKILKEKSRLIKLTDEHDLYARLQLPFVPVELRDRREVLDDALNGTTYDDLIEIDDIRGMTHCHSTFSDGVASVDEMVKAAKGLKKEYITITDHSPTAHYANGVSSEKLREQWDQIAAAEAKHDIRVLRGTESDILADGSLDYPSAVLGQLDVIIASIHSRMKMDEEQMTNRLLSCMRQPQFKIWGHALGRLVLKRDPIPCRVEEVIEVASQSRVAIEVNGDPYRLDMEPKWLRQARNRKMRFVISTDAHSVRDMHNLKFGIHLARRAGMKKSEVLNALSAEEFCLAVKP